MSRDIVWLSSWGRGGPVLLHSVISDFYTSRHTTMAFQTRSNRPSSFRKTLKGLITAPPSNLITVVQAVVEASMAFSPLQPATGGLLKAIKMVEGWLFSPQSCSNSAAVGSGWRESMPEFDRTRLACI